MSKVMSNGNGYVKFPINEPAEGKRKSQIEEYLDFHAGPGVQHIALATKDIVHTVSRLQEQGVEFLRVPHSYYTELQKRVGKIDEPLEELERLGILVDRDDEGHMLQIFTRPVEDRPTLFFEIIQRKGVAALERVTSRRCLKPSNESSSCAAICDDVVFCTLALICRERKLHAC